AIESHHPSDITVVAFIMAATHCASSAIAVVAFSSQKSGSIVGSAKALFVGGKKLTLSKLGSAPSGSRSFGTVLRGDFGFDPLGLGTILCITKVGPDTIAEAINTSLPIILNDYIPGQVGWLMKGEDGEVKGQEREEVSKRSKSGHRFGFVRFKNVNDINPLVSNLRVTWMGGFHLFADVAKYGRTNNRVEERSGDSKPNEVEKNLWGVSVSNKANEELSNEALMFISEDDCIDFDGMEHSILAKVKDLSVITDLLKYMCSEGFIDVGLRYVGGRWVWLEFDSTDQVESVKNSKVLNELFLELKDVSYDFISDERCVWIDLVGLPLASWAPEVYKKLGGRWGCSVFTDMVNDGPMSHGKVYVLTESLHRVLESFKVSYRNRYYCITATELAYWAPNIESTEDKSMIDSLERKDYEGPSLDGGSEHEEPLDVDNCDSFSSKYDNNDLVLSSEMSSTSRLMREVDVRGVDSDHVDSFEEGEIIGDSVLNNDGCVKDCMEKNLDDDVVKDIEDCSKNVTEKCGVVNNNMSNNVEGEILEDHFDGDRGNDTIEDNADLNPSTNVYLDVNQNTCIPEVVEDLSYLDKSSDKAERLAHHNNGLDDLDISLRNRLLHQDKCRVRSVKAAINDFSIVSPSTPPGTDLNLAEESYSTWLDYVGPLITDELDYEKRWSYRDPDGNV
ncbi:hypothetical protein Tco_0549514, partial [Tanacetum coccineum]